MAAAVYLLALPASTALGAEPDPALVARQDALFERMRADPANLDLMFDYAQVALRAGDYEAAITTFERMLIFRKDLPRVQLELGAAYYRLGAYDTADYYFEKVLAANPPPEVREKIAAFRGEIEERDEDSTFYGYVQVGGVYSTNANLGPEEREIDAAVLGGVGFLDADATSEDDFGVRASGFLGHAYDLDRDNEDAWLTSLAGTALRFFEETTGNLDAVLLRTGPRLSLGEGLEAPKLRPFGSLTYVRSGNDPLYAAYGGGLEYSNPLNADWSVQAAASAQYRDYLEGRDDFDGPNVALSAGAAYGGLDDTVLRASVVWDADLTGTPFTENHELGVQGSVLHSYTPGIGPVPEAPWNASAYARLSRRWYDGPDSDIDTDTTRRDWDVTLGASNAIPIADNVSVIGSVRYFLRDSNIRNFDLDSFETGLDVRVSF